MCIIMKLNFRQSLSVPTLGTIDISYKLIYIIKYLENNAIVRQGTIRCIFI